MKKGTQQNNKTRKKSRVSHIAQTSLKNNKNKQKANNPNENTSSQKDKKKKRSISNKSLNKKQHSLAPYILSRPQSSCRKSNTLKQILPSSLSNIKSMSKSMPLKFNQKKNKKYLQFPFQSIKFKQNNFNTSNRAIEHKNQAKTHDNFYIQYDQPQEDFTPINTQILQNSKRIVNSYNQRLSRYNNKNNDLKSNKNNSKKTNQSNIKNHTNTEKPDLMFQDSIFKLFRLLDTFNKGVISAEQVDRKKLPQAALYFLGGVFQKIRDRQLLMTPKQFQIECYQVYKRSSKEDVNWFISQIGMLSSRITNINIRKLDFQTDNRQNLGKKDAHYSSLGFNPITQMPQTSTFINQESKVQQIMQISTQRRNQNNHLKNDPNYSFSFQNQQSSVISFRKKYNNGTGVNLDENESGFSRNDMGREYQSSSYQSAKFCLPNQGIDSFASQKRDQLMRNSNPVNLSINHLHHFSGNTTEKDQKKRLSHNTSDQSDRNDFKSLNQNQNWNINRTGQIRKNIISNKPEDIRQQIYTRLQKMKITQQLKQENILRQNFTKGSNSQNKHHQNSIKLYKNILNNKQNAFQTNKVNIKSQNSYKPVDYTKNNLLDNKLPLKQLIKHSNSKLQTQSNAKPSYSQILQNSLAKKSSMRKTHSQIASKQTQSLGSSKWQSKNKNCQNAYNDIQKLRQQFNKQKEIVQKRQKQRQNYFKDQFTKLNTKVSQQVGQSRFQQDQQSRIVKIFENKQFFSRDKDNSLKSRETVNELKYQKNIDRLNSVLNSSGIKSSNLKNSTFTNIKNLKDSLINSSRKSFQVSLPLKYDSKQALSEKKTSFDINKSVKLDKIDQLSNKIEQYLKKNAEKIEVSQHFTGTTGRFNDIFA